MKNPSEYVKSFYDDQKELAETILSDGVPEVSTDDAAVTSELSIPTYDDLPSSPDDSDGTPIAHATGNGADAEGLHYWDGTQWVQEKGSVGGDTTAPSISNFTATIA
jgi:hypothetical protein